MELARQLGVTQANFGAEDAKPLAIKLQESYATLTLSELSAAVDLLFAEKLRDAEGKTLGPNSHYQGFTWGFLSLWLNAYRRYRQKSVAKLVRTLPRHVEPEKSLYHKLCAQLEFREAACAAFEAWQRGDRDEYAHALPDVFDLLQQEGLFAMPDARKWDLFRQAKANLEAKKATANLADYAEALRSGKDISEAQIKREAMRLACLEAFEGLTDLRALLQVKPEPVTEEQARLIRAKLQRNESPEGFSQGQIFEAIRTNNQ